MIDYTPRFTTVLDFGDDPRWHERMNLIPAARNTFDQIRIFIQLLLNYCTEPIMLLDSRIPPLHPELFAATLSRLMPRKHRPATVLMGDMWQPDTGLTGRLQAFLVRLADPAIDLYALQSTRELELFSETWGIAPSKLRVCPFYATLTAHPPQEPDEPVSEYIFAGGNSHRDYDVILEAARALPQHSFILASHLLADRTDIPANVTAGPVPHDEFMQHMHRAAVILVPLQTGLVRAAGQTTYLNAMYLGKDVIVTDAPGVCDHITHMHSGLVTDGSARSYIDAIRWLYDPANQSERIRIRLRGQRMAREQYTYENHVTRVLEILDESLQIKKS